MDTADRNSDLFDEFLCTFVELDGNNYDDLVSEVEKKEDSCDDVVEVIHRNAAFEDVIEEMIDDLGDKTILPSFFFIDPFGYNSMPFETVSDILNLRDEGVEVFLTFMVRDIRRFLQNEGHENSITRILGTDEWKDINSDAENKEEEILKIYERQLEKEAGVDYAWPFEMKMPERSETVYYLIHATNHFKGFKIMKDVMFKEGAEDKFAYLGPDHYAYDSAQQSLFESTETEDNRVSELASFLFERFDGERLKFWDIMKRTYKETDLIEKHYRSAIYSLEEEQKAKIHNFGDDRENSTENGLDKDDEVTFERQNADLRSFL